MPFQLLNPTTGPINPPMPSTLQRIGSAVAGPVMGTIDGYRNSIGGAILLGLELLVAADIVKTVTSKPSLTDAAILATLPAGARLKVMGAYWEITTGFTGGSSSAIGISSSNSTGHTTKGDIHGGSGGDVAATLADGYPAGTIGADVAAGLMMVAADTLRFDRVTSAFTAGVGAAHIVGFLTNPGA